MRAYSQDLRDRVLNALARGERPVAIARRFEVSRIWVYQVRERFEQHGERDSRKVGGYRVSAAAVAKKELHRWIARQPDLTLKELAQRLQEKRNITLSPFALWHQLNKWGLTFKKNVARRRTGTPGCTSGSSRVAKKSAFLGA